MVPPVTGIQGPVSGFLNRGVTDTGQDESFCCGTALCFSGRGPRPPNIRALPGHRDSRNIPTGFQRHGGGGGPAPPPVETIAIFFRLAWPPFQSSLHHPGRLLELRLKCPHHSPWAGQTGERTPLLLKDTKLLTLRTLRTPFSFPEVSRILPVLLHPAAQSRRRRHRHTGMLSCKGGWEVTAGSMRPAPSHQCWP